VSRSPLTPVRLKPDTPYCRVHLQVDSRLSVRRAMLALIASVGIFALACSSSTDTPDTESPKTPDGRSLHAITLPDLSKVAPSVQKQIQQQHALLESKLSNRNAPARELSEAYGQMGKLLMAAEYADAAQLSFENAQTLDSSDFRWPYYLAHLARTKGDVTRALNLFERVNQLQPDDVAALVWLGDLELAQGRPDAAEPHFTKALTLQPRSLSARFGLGRTALAKQDFRRAVTLLEEVLAQDPGALGAHYPLGMAYSGLGDSKKADEHLRQRREHEILPADPLIVELEELLQSPQTYERLGIRALDRQDWTAAAAEFRKGLVLDPASPALRHRLGTALAMIGDARGARAEFEDVVRVTPGYARAQYSLALLAVESGDYPQAIDRFLIALKSEPDYVEARIGLADSLRRTGRPGESVAQYQQVLKDDSRRADAALGYALALVQLRRWAQARDRLSEFSSVHLDDPRFTHALARVLAAAPDDAVRDGGRAMALVEELLAAQQKSPDLGETMAMALAALGRFEEAASLQRNLMSGAERAGAPEIARRLRATLTR
jgi:tetratricopeptide (TPR) repeat protein